MYLAGLNLQLHNSVVIVKKLKCITLCMYLCVIFELPAYITIVCGNSLGNIFFVYMALNFTHQTYIY